MEALLPAGAGWRRAFLRRQHHNHDEAQFAWCDDEPQQQQLPQQDRRIHAKTWEISSASGSSLILEGLQANTTDHATQSIGVLHSADQGMHAADCTCKHTGPHAYSP